VNLPKIDSKFTKEEEGIFARKISFSEKIYTSVENLVTKTYYKIRRIPLIEEKRKLIDIGFWLLVFKGTWNTFSGRFRTLDIKAIIRANQLLHQKYSFMQVRSRALMRRLHVTAFTVWKVNFPGFNYYTK
jgi:hypothetical protein